MHGYGTQILDSDTKKLDNCRALADLFQNFKKGILIVTLMISVTLKEGRKTFHLKNSLQILTN